MKILLKILQWLYSFLPMPSPINQKPLDHIPEEMPDITPIPPKDEQIAPKVAFYEVQGLKIPLGKKTGWNEGTKEDKQEMLALTRKICLEENIPLQMGKEIEATIYGESGFNQWCINQISRDYGISQFSLRYYCKEYNITPQECLDNPEKCLRIMAQNFKKGRQSNWVAYNKSNFYLYMNSKVVI